MGRLFKRTAIFFILFIFSLALSNHTAKADTVNFSDVPEGHWAYNDILTLKKLNVTQGIGNNAFGLSRSMTRAEFVTFLAKLFNWDTGQPAADKPWYEIYVSAAVTAGAIGVAEASAFRPDEPITREEIAVMLIRSLGYDSLAQQLSTLPAPFADVTKNIGFITMAKDFGLIYGVTDTAFSPSASATREQGAAMMVRLYNNMAAVSLLSPKSGWLNAFYAISSNSQKDLISMADSVSFGWSRIEWRDGVYLNMTSSQNNEYNRPSGYETVLSDARAQNKQALMMVTVEGKSVSPAGSESASQGLSSYLLGNGQLRHQMVTQIAAAAADFDGVVIDFENLRGAQTRQDFNAFLSELKGTLRASSNQLYVAVQPVRQPGQPYYDGYDYRAIARAADKVILMAHDYYAKSLTDEEMSDGFNVTPLAPINEVYYALKAITDPVTGVEDASKILLQFSFDTVQWKTQNGVIVNKTPYNPTYDAISSRVAMGAIPQYSYKYESPFITFFNEDDGTDNIVWYENKQSIAAKLNLAAMFRINGVSLWRLGIIPNDVIGLFD